MTYMLILQIIGHACLLKIGVLLLSYTYCQLQQWWGHILDDVEVLLREENLIWAAFSVSILLFFYDALTCLPCLKGQDEICVSWWITESRLSKEWWCHTQR